MREKEIGAKGLRRLYEWKNYTCRKEKGKGTMLQKRILIILETEEEQSLILVDFRG